MKHLHIFSIMISALFFACKTENKSESFIIEGSLPQNTNGMIFLYEFKNREYTAVDSVEIKNGHFSFKGKVETPLLYSLQLNKQGKKVNFFVENNQISLKINENFELESINGAENTLLHRKYDVINQKNTINLDSLLQKDTKSEVIAYFLAKNAYLYDYNSLNSLRKQLSQSLDFHPYVKEIDEVLLKLEKLEVGNPAPEILLEDPNGNQLKLSDLKGKIVLIDFWASWCPDCRKENPNLVNIYNEYKDKNFTILGVSLDKNKDHWKQAIAKDGLVWEQGLTEGAWKSEVVKTYAIRWLPTSILIDENGIIVARSINNNDIIKHIDNLLKIK